LVVRVDGELELVPADDEQVTVDACGGSVKLVRKGATLEVVGKPVERLVVHVPASIGAVTVHEHDGAVRSEVPARLAVISSTGPLDVTGAASLRVAYLDGDVTVSDVVGAVTTDHVTGTVSGGTLTLR
jgi:hypothetical protein